MLRKFDRFFLTWLWKIYWMSFLNILNFYLISLLDFKRTFINVAVNPCIFESVDTIKTFSFINFSFVLTLGCHQTNDNLICLKFPNFDSKLGIFLQIERFLERYVDKLWKFIMNESCSHMINHEISWSFLWLVK